MDMTPPTSPPDPKLTTEDAWRDRTEKAATIVSFLLRKTQDGELTWEDVGSAPTTWRLQTVVDGRPILVVRHATGGVKIYAGTAVDNPRPLFPQRIESELKPELWDLASAIRFQVDAPPPEFDDLLRIATSDTD